MKELQHLNKYFYKYRFRLIVGILITIASKIFILFTPRLTRDSVDIVDQYLKNEVTDIEIVRSVLLENISLIIGAALLTGLLTFFMRQTIINVSRYIEFDLKNEIYQHYQKLSLNFYKKNRTGDLMNRITEDVGKVRMYVGPAIMYSINTITLFIVSLTYMYNQAPTLTLYTVLPLPILSVINYKVSKAIHKRSTVVQQYLSKLSTFTQESFSGISVIKSYGIESQTFNDFDTLSEDSKQKKLHLVSIQAWFFPMMILLIGISNLIVIYIGGTMYIDGKITIGTILEFIIYVNMLTWPVATVGWVTSIIQEAAASQARINEFLNTKQDIESNNNTPEDIAGEIEFKNVSFIYDDTNIEALKNISFKINQGETLAIIGRTGSGKSTILDLIGRLYDTSSGQILIDHKPIDSVNLSSLRSAIGYVPQDAFLFSDTIKNNILFGKDDATELEIINAATMADVHKNIIDFKEGYNTILGERGVTLSGGQKQRVSIARAIIKSPDILLFDDCLSAVDTETEEKILNNLKAVTKGKTTVIVSHRISSAKNADRILILEDGTIAQQGTHDQLINEKGYYQELYNKQLTENLNS
jgi:ATP-binding cassette subfamily B protein